MYLTSDFLVHVICIPYVCHLSDMCIPCILPCVSHVSDMCMARFSHVSDMTCVRHVSVRHVSDMCLTCVCHVSDTCYIAPRSRRKSLSRAARGAARQGGRRRRSRRGRRRLLSRTRRRRRSRGRSRRLRCRRSRPCRKMPVMCPPGPWPFGSMARTHMRRPLVSRLAAPLLQRRGLLEVLLEVLCCHGAV